MPHHLLFAVCFHCRSKSAYLDAVWGIVRKIHIPDVPSVIRKIQELVQEPCCIPNAIQFPFCHSNWSYWFYRWKILFTQNNLSSLHQFRTRFPNPQTILTTTSCHRCRPTTWYAILIFHCKVEHSLSSTT